MQEFKELINYDKALEQTMLGVCLLDNTAFARMRGILAPECFYFDSHKLVFQAFTEMWEMNLPVDLLTATQYLAQQKKIVEIDDASTPYYLMKLTNYDPRLVGVNLEHYALIARQLYVGRELINIQNSPPTKGDVLERLSEMRDKLQKLSTITVVNDWKDMGDVVLKLYQHMDRVKDKEIIGIPSGFRKLDLITGGWIPGDLIVLAARPSVGKSAMLGALAVHAAEQGYKVGIKSLEMTDIQIGARMGSSLSDVPFFKIFRNLIQEEKEREHLYAHLVNLANLTIKISDSSSATMNDIRASVAQLIYKWGIGILFIDYLQLVESDASGNRNYNREQEVSKMSRGFKLMAKEFNIPIILLAQLNRESEKTANKKPMLHHLRESGSIEQDADLVLFLHRDFKSGILTNENGSSTEHEADIIIAKGRNIELDEVKIGWDGSRMKFYDLEQRKLAQPQNGLFKPGTPNYF